LVGAVYVGHVVSGEQVAVPVHPVSEYMQRLFGCYRKILTIPLTGWFKQSFSTT
jgi:hypothetical protein